MASYVPHSRRPIAGIFRRTAGRAVRFCVDHSIHPDWISYASILFSALAGLAFAFTAWSHWLLLIAPLFCLLRLWCNMLDGMVAFAAGKASRRGEILNDLPDRFSDVLIFAGLAHSGLVHPPLAYWAAIAALLTAYVGLFGQALGGKRQFGGIMSKPWRMVALMIGAWVVFAMKLLDVSPYIGLASVLDIACVIVIAGCVQTMFVRLRRIVRDLEGITPT